LRLGDIFGLGHENDIARIARGAPGKLTSEARWLVGTRDVGRVIASSPPAGVYELANAFISPAAVFDLLYCRASRPRDETGAIADREGAARIELRPLLESLTEFAGELRQERYGVLFDPP
jgi:hypothetical protein